MLSANPIATAATTPSPVTRTWKSLETSLYSSQGVVILGCLIFLAATYTLSGRSKKGKLARGKFGGGHEKRVAKRCALQQMRERSPNAVSVWVGQPTDSLIGRSPLYLPDAQRGIAVLGAPGTGKTVSVIDQIALSVLDQGFPTIMWDFKYPRQTERIVGYAKSKGYQVHIFAPGYPESAVCNPLQFLENEADSLMARQFAEVMNANFKRTGHTSEDGFFGPAGDQVTEAILMLARSSKYTDLPMCQALASRTDLAQHILNKKDELNPWVLASFGQLLSSAQSEKTVSSILATANINFTRFIKGDILPAFCGRTSIPTILEGKKLLVLGLDREKRDVLAPLIATILHMLVNKNVTIARKNPLFLIADELPTLYLPALHHWLNENREDGLCCVLGFQNVVQMEKIYGKELARAIIGGCATKIIFNPQDFESAKLFSDYLGQKEVSYRQRSHGRSGGKGSTTYSEQIQTKALFEASDFLQLPTGRCILLNPHFQRRRESYIPLLESISLSSGYKQTIKRSKAAWSSVRDLLIEQSTQMAIAKSDLQARYKVADEMFPPRRNTQARGSLSTDKFLNLL
ncbi:type IV secretory system conjugative DNA transfer family protein [Chroococcidiopsidales cyanobacterium LEGE 13417]|nr:type IV secretory system conjugative DNA transfer family protein [Chroococcidiopsidales cyanobacterium LEGE 13417]